jgi:glycine dehydrogenase subunit 2
VLGEILRKAKADPNWLEHAPYTTAVRRLDEVLAAKKPVLSFKKLKLQ